MGCKVNNKDLYFFDEKCQVQKIINFKKNYLQIINFLKKYCQRANFD